MNKKKESVSTTRNIVKELSDLPTHLYRYSGISGERLDWIRKVILESELYFPSPAKFNDPFDCKIPVNYRATNLRARSYWTKVGKRENPGISPQELTKAVKKLVHDSRTTEGKKEINKSLFQSLDENGIASFTKAPTNMLMWSYYAEGHSGIALRFNMSLENLVRIPNKTIPIQVNYSHEFPNLNFYQVDDDWNHFIATEIGTKSIEWEHEEEWRLISVNRTGYHQIPSEMLDGIILGKQISKENERLIREWAKEKGSDIEILKVTHEEHSFDLKLIPLG